jgi:DUF971 family protein
MISRPKRIAVTKSEAKLKVEWEDGLDCEYSLSFLRAECPCAECRGTHGTADQVEPKLMLELPIVNTSSTVLDRIEKVGNYAIQLYWRDGHSHGIYSWDYLRNLCPSSVQES